MRDWTSLNSETLFDKFQETARESLRLDIALYAFFQSETPQDQKDAYEKYLRRRIRPAVESLMETEDIEKLEIWERLGWLEDAGLDNFIQLAREKRRTSSLVWLLRLKKERGYYHDREYIF